MSDGAADPTAIDRATLARPLTDIWYFAGPASEVKAGKAARRFFLGHPVALGRTDAGKPFALLDVCAHRAAPLSPGRQLTEGGKTCIECPYHGWRFDVENGACRKIPALSEHEQVPTDRMRTPVFPLHEDRGLLWIYIPQDIRRFDGKPKQAPPQLPDGVPGAKPKLVLKAPAEGPFDEAVIGLIDPAHTPYVHQNWFWRRPDGAREKVKEYEPVPFGFRMKPHQPSSNGRAYRLIGGAATTEIEFRLPAIRLELIRNERYTILGLTGITPTEDGKSIITQNFFWDMPLLSVLKPFVTPFGRHFLGQDGYILRLQNENLKRGLRSSLYVGDPDRLAQWYMSLKRAYLLGGAQGFENPVSEATLRWRT